ncbi:MAG: purine/pyrimidine permease [Lentisphaerae bacterium]|nr:purine/pyrimidine permease [Lentisphaerota bacterium]
MSASSASETTARDAANLSPGIPAAMLAALEHAALYAVSFAFPALLIRHAGMPDADAMRLIQTSFIAMGLVTFLTALKYGKLGAGLFCPAVTGPSFFSLALLSVKEGGLALLSGMLLTAGLIQVLVSQVLHRLRFLLSADLMGVVVLMIGITGVTFAAPVFLGCPQPGAQIHLPTLAVAIITLLIMSLLSVRGSGLWRRYSMLIGLAAGMALAWLFNVRAPLFTVSGTPALFEVPFFGRAGLAFKPALLLPCALAALISALKACACLIASRQVAGEAEAVPARAEPISNGVLAVGLGNAFSGLAGGLGVSASAGNVGLSLATGVAGRRLAFVLSAGLLLLGFSPRLTSVLISMPMPVMGACLLYSISFMLVLAFRLLTAQTFDARKTFVLGIAITFGFCADLLPGLFPGGHSQVTDRLNLSILLALCLSLVFRIRARRPAECSPGK